jgi:perosamine synthetase
LNKIDWRETSVLVTGGTGSFGKALIQTLLDGYQPRRIAVLSRDELKQSELKEMRRLPWILAEKERIACAYDEAILGIPGLQPAPRPGYATRQSWFMYSVTCETRAVRDAMASRMEDEGIETRNGFPPIHSQPYFREQFGYGDSDFPVTMSTWERKLDIPCWAGMPEDTQGQVIDSMKRSLA